MSTESIHILLIEDSPGYTVLIREAFRDVTALHVELESVETLADGIARIQQANPDAVLLDLSLPDSHGIGTLTKLRGIAPAMPILVLTSLDDEALAMTALQLGAQDYLVKAQVESSLLARAVRYAIERKREQEKIVQSEYLLTLAQQVAQMGSWQWDVASDVVSWSDALYHIYGLDPRTFNSNYEGYLETVHPDDRALVSERIANALRDGKSFQFDHRIIRPDGSTRILNARGEVFTDAAGKPIKMIGTAQDITERKQMEQEVHLSREQLRLLAGHLQSAREEERRNIAREIHDQLGQGLTALKMDLAMLNRRAVSNNNSQKLHETVAREVPSIMRVVDNIIMSVREIMTQLRPEFLEEVGLRSAIEWQVQEFQTRTGTRAEFNSGVEQIDLDLERSIAVFRILQESLTNVARHAQATHVNVRLNAATEQLTLEVEDNGRGLKRDDSNRQRSFGILGMQERALLLGGEVHIRDVVPHGTLVRLQIPLASMPAALPPATP